MSDFAKRMSARHMDTTAVPGYRSPMNHSTVIQQYSQRTGYHGLDIATSAQLLRRYAFIERGLMRMLAGWFLAAPAYETKYAFGYHLRDHADHVDWLRTRLAEMRGGLIRASAEPALAHCIEETQHAPDTDNFIAAAYLELESSLLDCYLDHLDAADASANAAEIRVIERLIPATERHVKWAQEQVASNAANKHSELIRALLRSAGGITGLEEKPAPLPSLTSPTRFVRPSRIAFDGRIRQADLVAYEKREAAELRESTIEDFKVFFNEFYAAGLLATVIFDADPAEVPWDFFADLSKHFWDEVRHSEFGALRLKELGVQPEICNQTLFGQTQDLPILHRVCYLTLGLETFFMPRKAPRVKKFLEVGDPRSQLFADQDWSDEITHVRYGKRWVDFLLENDLRTPEDVLDEVKKHIETVSGQRQETIAAPF